MPRKGPRCPGYTSVTKTWVACFSSKFILLRDGRSSRLKCVSCGTEFSTRARHLYRYAVNYQEFHKNKRA